LSRVESSGCGGDHRHEPVVLSLKPLVVLGHLGAKAGVELVKALLRSEQSFARYPMINFSRRAAPYPEAGL